MILISKQGETRLVETLGDINDQHESWTVLVYNFSNLLEEYKSDYQLKIAMNLSHDLLQALDGGIYLCNNGDMAILVRNVNPQLAKKLTFQLRYLYMDDPLAYLPDGSENEAFLTIYPLGTHFDMCFNQFSRQMVTVGRAERGGSATKPSALQAFNAARMANFEKELPKADISKALRKQAVCVYAQNGQIRRVFDETYIHISHMREILKADVDFLSNKWLFKYLTQLLDKRVLELLLKEKTTLLASPISININTETLLSDEFLAFDAALSPTQKVSVVFELPVVDAFVDTHGFIAAVNHAQKLGYRVCLDGLNDMGFVQISPALLGVDLIKLQWNANVAQELNLTENKLLKDAVERVGGKRVILCRCDSMEAVEYGRALGISLFQGRYIDMQANPNQPMVN
jgi:EAL domain-containing protein (putative c-di-GMP-specific phosphodiesterase class I)